MEAFRLILAEDKEDCNLILLMCDHFYISGILRFIRFHFYYIRAREGIFVEFLSWPDCYTAGLLALCKNNQQARVQLRFCHIECIGHLFSLKSILRSGSGINRFISGFGPDRHSRQTSLEQY